MKIGSFFLNSKTLKNAVRGALVVNLALTAAGCKSLVRPSPETENTREVPAETYTPGSKESQTETSTQAFTQTATVTPTPTETPTPKEVDFSQLIPMYEEPPTSNLTEEDILPYIGTFEDADIITSAEKELRDAGYGDKIDEITNKLLNYAQNESHVYLHTLEPVYALNTRSGKPVFTVFLYDKSVDRWLVPYAIANYDYYHPKEAIQINAHSGDVTEVLNTLEKEKIGGAAIRFYLLSPIPGIADNLFTVPIPTKYGITMGTFSKTGDFLGWYNFDNRIWNLSSKAKEQLKPKLEESEANLETNIDNWVSGKTVIDKSLIFDAGGGKPISFNCYDKKREFDASTSLMQLYGVLLGTKTIEGNLFVFMGFEDAEQHRYYIPFNLGEIGNDNNYYQGFCERLSAYGIWKAYDKGSSMSVEDIRFIIANNIGKPAIEDIYTGSYEQTSNFEISPILAEEYKSQQDYAFSIAKYVYDSAFNPIGGNNLGGHVNPPLDSIDPKDFPRSFVTFSIKD